MLRNIQIKIILIFLVIGIVIIGGMAYFNYNNLQIAFESAGSNIEDYNVILQNYQANIKVIAMWTIIIFIVICVLVRCDYHTKSNRTA